MSLWMDLTRLATALNVLVLLGLSAVWARNYARVRTRFTIGFLTFGGLLLAENAFALYLFAFDPTTSAWFADILPLYQRSLMILAVLQLAALAVLSWITLQ